MITRRYIMIGLALLAGSTASALTAETHKFDMRDFSASQAANTPIVVHINADWCTTCQAQKPILNKIKKTEKFKDIKFYEVDFDSQKDALKLFNVTKQSVIIVFKGNKELGRSIGDTNENSIEDLISKSL